MESNSFEGQQENLAAKAELFEKWCNKYGYTGLTKEYYQNRFEEGFDSENNERKEELLNLVPLMSEDGYITNDNNQKVTITKILSRDFHKIIITKDSDGGTQVFGTFGFYGIIKDKNKEKDTRISFKQNNQNFSTMKLFSFAKLFGVNEYTIMEWVNEKECPSPLILILIREEFNNSKSDEMVDVKNKEIVIQLLGSNEHPIYMLNHMNVDINKFLCRNISRFIYYCFKAILGIFDDRDHLKNKIVTQILFFLRPHMEFETKLNILTNFRERINSMSNNNYVNTSSRNQLDIWSSARKILLSQQEYMPFSARVLHHSFKRFLCPFETSDGIDAGLATTLSCLSVVSPGEKFDASFFPQLVNGNGKENSISFIYNGFFICNIMFDKKELNNFTKKVKKVYPFTSVYMVKNCCIHIDSYQGRVCRWNGKMFICSSMEAIEEEDELHPSLYLGFAASLIPFIQNNAGPRGIFMSNMLKQVLESNGDFEKKWYHYDEPSILTITTKALERTKIGMDVYIKWAVFHGYNIEDGIVVSKNFINKTNASGSRQYSFSMDVDSNNGDVLIFLSPRKGNIDHRLYDQNGIIREGVFVNNGDILACKLVEKDGIYTKEFLQASVDNTCIVSSSKVIPVQKGKDRIVIKVNYDFNLQIGDKMVSSSAQKGVISHITDEKVDLIINPCCIPSRMTLGQIYEGIILTKIKEHNLPPVYFPPFENHSLFLNKLNKIEKQNKNSLFDYIPNKGYWYSYNRYFVLGQRVDEKVRSIGKDSNINKVTGQPVKGRKNDGGLRLGLMEKDAILAHGSSHMLRDLFMLHSDGIKITEKGEEVEITKAALNIRYMIQAMGFTINWK